MRAAQLSTTAGSSFSCHATFLTCGHKERLCASTSTPPLVTNTHNQTPAGPTLTSRIVCPCVSPSPCVFQPVLNQPLCFSFCPPPIQDVILPGDTKRMVFIFKSEAPGIKTELWQLNTHPVLLQGASIQVTLRGVSLYQDKTADQRLFLEVLYN